MDVTETYLSFMVCILQADGKVHPNEARLFSTMLRQAGIRADLRRKYERAAQGKIEIDPSGVVERLPEVADATFLMWLVRDAYLMADADGRVSEAEEHLVEQLLRRAGVPESRFAEIRAWGLEAVRHARTGTTLFDVG